MTEFDLRSMVFVGIFLGICMSQAAAQSSPTPSPSPVRLNRTIELMQSGENAFGIFAWNLTARSGAAIADSSLDFVIIDLEHSPADVTRLESYLLGMTNKQQIARNGHLQPRVTPLVRVPSTGKERVLYTVKQVLDAGAMGVVVPHVETAEEALLMVQACRYPQRRGVADFEPVGKRGAAYRWPARYWGLTPEEYSQRADVWPLDPQGEILLWIMIESVEGLKNAREIAATPGVGGIFIGPGDLAFSMGVPPGDPSLEAAYTEILEACKAANVPCGTLTTADQVKKRLAQGFRFLAVGFDGGIEAEVDRAVRIGRDTAAP